MKYSRCCRHAIVLSAIVLLPFSVGAQAPEVPLSVGVPVQDSLDVGQTHVYTVAAQDNDFVFATVVQRGIDVIVRVVKPDGSELKTVDSPTGTSGAEFVMFNPEQSGLFRLEVKPFDDQQKLGAYEIELVRVEPVAATPERRVDQLLSPWTLEGSAGASVGVAKGDEILLSKGYGLANLEYDIPITPETIFHVASVSKEFAAFAVAMLADRGDISLDDDVRQYVPEVTDFGHTITLRHLIHHTSGLRDQWNLFVMAGWRFDDLMSTDQVLKLVSWQRELNFEPGSEYLYCNTGYTLLGVVVERVTGQRLAEWTATNIFGPLDMNLTHFHDDNKMIVKDRAYGYDVSPNGGFQKAILNYSTVGATSLFTTTGDLLKWVRNLKTGRVGGEGLTSLMMQRGVLSNGDTLSYAFGLGHGTYKGVDYVGHGGADAGFRTNLRWFPEADLSIAVLSNLSSFSPSTITDAIADIYLEKQLAASETANAQPQAAVRTGLDSVIVRDLAGYYRLWDSRLAEVRPDSLGLEWVLGGSRQAMLPQSDSTFKAGNRQLTFFRDENARVTGLKTGIGKAIRVAAYDSTRYPLSEYVGVYRSDELRTSYHLLVRDGALIAEHQRLDDVVLSPVVEDGFSGSAFQLQTLEFTRDDGQLDGFLVSNGRVRRLKFRRVE